MMNIMAWLDFVVHVKNTSRIKRLYLELLHMEKSVLIIIMSSMKIGQLSL